MSESESEKDVTEEADLDKAVPVEDPTPLTKPELFVIKVLLSQNIPVNPSAEDFETFAWAVLALKKRIADAGL